MVVPNRQLDLHYRHARNENMLIVGAEDNGNQCCWVRDQMVMFQRLGWSFITVDLSGELHPHNVKAGTLLDIEPRVLLCLDNPSIRVQTIQEMVETINYLVTLMKQGELPKTILLHLGSAQPDANSMRTIVKCIRRLLACQHGVWVVIPTLQSLPIEVTTKLFHAHILLDRVGIKNQLLSDWARLVGTDLSDWNISKVRSILVFNGRSQGAKGQVLVSASSEVSL